MIVRIAKNLALALEKTLKAAPFNEQFEELRWREHIEVSLADRTPDDLKKLRKECLKVQDIRGSKILAKDIDNWIAASTDPKAAKHAKARSCRQAFEYMINYLKDAPRHHLYKRVQMGNDGVTICYYVERISWTSKCQYVPEHFNLHLVYQQFGLTKTTRVSFDPSDTLRKSAHEILTDAGYYIESEALRADYEHYVECYTEWKEKIGLQFWAVGYADDEDVDGNDSESTSRWWRRLTKLVIDNHGAPMRVVVDVFRETKQDDEEKNEGYSAHYWEHHKAHRDTGEDEEIEIDDTDEPLKETVEIPVHPYLVVFDLKKHKRLRVHVGNLTLYKYDTSIRKKLILPENCSALIDTLLSDRKKDFTDVIGGKTGGTIVLCQGPPGTGKTLTAEVYAEAEQRALYTIQCSQLGTDPDKLEDNLLKILHRGNRWGAITLLDEADVYVHERGNDLVQNAIVGVFLRVLEYHAGTLFLTTNRGDLVDDAILSRCTARIPYRAPEVRLQCLIWEVLTNENNLDLTPKQLKEIVSRQPNLSGRDVKNILKLAIMVATDRKCEINADLIDELMQFRPTFSEKQNADRTK